MKKDTASPESTNQEDVLVGDELDNGGPVDAPIEPDPEDHAAPPVEARVARLEQGMSDILTLLQAQNDVLETAIKKKQDEAPPPPPDAEGRKRYKPIPKGSVRFRSYKTEQVMIRDPGFHEVVNGRPMFVHARQCEFHNGILDETRPDMIDWLREHPENGTTFVEDPYAVPASMGPMIQEGGRGAGKTPRDRAPGHRQTQLEAPV